MCGITGVCGKYAAYKAMNITLAQVSRGKMGAGVAWIDRGDSNETKMWMLKAPVDPLVLAVSQHYFSDIVTEQAIGHNRMPSHGAVSKENSHPFYDCKGRFALAHNGTIHFSHEDSDILKSLGHKIVGETDSEILTHILCEKMNEGKSMEQCLEEVIANDTTLATFVVLMKNGEIWAVKDWMPLHLCKITGSRYGNYTIVASETDAIDIGTCDLEGERTFQIINHGDLVHILPNGEYTIKEHKEVSKKSGTKVWESNATYEDCEDYYGKYSKDMIWDVNLQQWIKPKLSMEIVHKAYTPEVADRLAKEMDNRVRHRNLPDDKRMDKRAWRRGYE